MTRGKHKLLHPELDAMLRAAIEGRSCRWVKRSYAQGMALWDPSGSVLVLDTCGERGAVALFRAGVLQTERVLAERTASASLLQVIRSVLDEHGLRVRDLAGVGVVNGPGSFTGLRVGLAVAKGLCEAGELLVAPVSRLAVLAQAGALRQGFAVLRAGRDELYMREVRPNQVATEQLVSAAAFVERVGPEDLLVYAEEALLPMLPQDAHFVRVELTAAAAFSLAEEALRDGGADLPSLDGNYVRNEQAIYRQNGAR